METENLNPQHLDNYVKYLEDVMSNVSILRHIEKELNKKGLIVETILKENLTMSYFKKSLSL